MNEEPPTPFDTIGDEPVEARIVAWVLGEASAFEAAELERLCEERPELLVFRRRMRALHGLLTEAEAAEPDHSWKLPAEKRKVLDEIFGEEKVVRLEPQKELRIRRSGRRAVLAIAACVAITFFVIRMTPWKHEAEAIIEVKPRVSGMSPFGGDSAAANSSSSLTPQFFGTEFEKIKSRNSLEKVVDNLDLASRWNLDKESAIKRVKDSIETRNLDGTDLISIRVRDASERDAQEITQEVVEAYKKYRSGIEQREAEKGLFELKKAVRDQEDKVEERRKVLAMIVRTKGINYKGQDSFYGQSGVDEDQGARRPGEVTKDDTREEAIKRGLDAQDYVDAKREFEADQQLLQSMKLKQINETITKQLTEDSIVVHEMTPRLAAEESKSKPGRREASAGKSEVAYRIDTAEIAENNDAQSTRWHSTPGQPATPAAAPVGRTSTASQTESLASRSDREVGASESLRQSAGGAAADSFSLADATPPAQAAAPAAELAMKLPGRPTARGIIADEEVVSQSRSGINLNERFGTGRDVAGPPDDIPADPSQFASNGRFGGLRSGDQAINRNNIDAILNNPSEPEAEGLAKAKGIKAESDAKPSNLAVEESGSARLPRPRVVPPDAEIGDMLDALAGPSLELPEAQKRFADGAEGGNSSAGTVVLGVELEADFAYQSSSAGSADHGDNVDQLRRNLNTAEGNYNLGKYDDAKKAYQDALAIDPYNQAARRGLEQVESAKTDYYRASNDHTRAELLGQVDSAWELTVPADKESTAVNEKDADGKKKQKKTAKEVDESMAEVIPPSEIEEGIARGRKQLEDPSLSDSKKQELVEALKVLESLQKEYSSEYDFKAAGLAERQQRLAILRRQLDDHGDFKKQAIFKEWQNLKKEIDEMTDEEPPAETDEVPVTLTDLIEEIPATENPYSTFSLNISDASFQLAKAALAKGERPDPASIKPEQFYNAVDYGDPAPASNEPVAATIEQSAHPVIPGRNLVRVALRTGSVGRSAVQPLRLTLLVDQSGSMVREDRRASMEHALSQLGVLLTKADLVTVIGFSRTPHLLADGMTGDQAAKLGELVNQTASEGGTNLEEALKLGGQLAARHQLAGAQNRIVLFTDGAANLGDANPDRLAEQVKALRQKGIAFDIAGIGADGLNDRLLSELARNGNGRYYVVGNENNDSFARQLAGAFRPAAENVKVQVNFNPQRVGKYKLIGFEKDRLKTEDFRNDAVDAAELAAEEAGVAIYQVEPLAEGSGELGEVSVRFRDAASKEMVERTWTISYDAQATAFDRATPSMQLAGLSLLAAEKLKGGPLADAIDFKQLTGPSAFVKQFYGSSPRVADMLQVIEKLK